MEDVLRNILAWHHNQCLPGKGRNLSHEELPNPLQRCCVQLDKFHAFASQPQSLLGVSLPSQLP